jgi:hypothetical protein
LLYDKPEGNLVFSQLNLPPILDNVTFENANISNPTAGSLSAIGALGDINAIDPDLTLPQQTQEYARSAADPEAHPSTQS